MPDNGENDKGRHALDEETLRAKLEELKARVASLRERVDALEEKKRGQFTPSRE
ncbi:MAG TPA: hypothetical protein VGK31_05045 [Thermoanaerobaculia bacterium]|jgi:polyhydroxyalkanoate synthesis regulator phasin